MQEKRSDCDIRPAGKRRDGRPRFWCHAHQASATGKYGIKLERCEGAYRSLESKEILELNPKDYDGGVALWGAVKPAYDSTGLEEVEGIHVHARDDAGDLEKGIDDTVDAVALEISVDLFEKRKVYVTRETAVSAYISRAIGHNLDSLFCTYCGEPHLDSEWFAVKPHKRHLCHACGEIFLANKKGISNPLKGLRQVFQDSDANRSIVRAERRLEASVNDFPGGIQMWASNPALLWTAPRPEEEGIHFHGYAADRSTRLEDETFDAVVLDGIEIDESHLRYFMAQNALAHLRGRIVVLVCDCGEAYFDNGMDAFIPHSNHRCKSCNIKLSSSIKNKKVISNPFLNTIQNLDNNRGKK
ncbi:hypothetical protein [Pseudoblastomonas halimionae]|uniref:Uncharacterized protein n=1 Tax=Alteriqipengyuania halimionae TaxID=1926630 RepID=A0A6I4U100_9SPHN|nr:hypothetical protein [Alteriqipengyuania halimionae]MXP09719.1 hypothetical protein [Alteriqipengyuania halimionae]